MQMCKWEGCLHCWLIKLLLEEYLDVPTVILCLILRFHVCARAGLTWISAILIQVTDFIDFKCDLKKRIK